MKFVNFAVLAATVLVTAACSSEDLTENGTKTSTAEGIPFKVNLSIDGKPLQGSRAVDLTGSNLSEFNLFGFKLDGKDGNPASAEAWLNIKATVGNGSASFSGETPMWPDKESYNNIFAYYTGDEGKLGYKPSVTKDGQTIEFAPTFAGSNSDATNSVLDARDEKDILVASVADAQPGTDGTVSIDFKHALASIKFKAAFDEKKLKNNKTFEDLTATNYFALVKSITICNMPIKGTYSLATGKWTLDDNKTKGNYKIVYDDLQFVPMILKSDSKTTPTEFKSTTGGSLLVLPCTNDDYVVWSAKDDNNKESLKPVSDGAYLDIWGIVFAGKEDKVYTEKPLFEKGTDGEWKTDGGYENPDDDWSLNSQAYDESGQAVTEDNQDPNQEKNYAHLYIPFKLSNGFMVNGEYTYNIDMDHIYVIADGVIQPLFDDATVE